MNSFKKWERTGAAALCRAATVGVVAALATTGCETAGNTLSGAGDAVVGWFIDDHMKPTIIAAAEEKCVAIDIVLEQTGMGDVGFLGSGVVKEIAELASSDEGAAMFCKQNLIGAATVTQKALDLMLTEVGDGFADAYAGLETKDKDIEDTLLAVQQLEGQGASAYTGDGTDATIEKISKVSASLQARIDERIEAGGLSEEARKHLIEAAQHLRGASYYRGKALVGATLIVRQLQKEGVESLVQDAVQTKGTGQSVAAIKTIATGGLSLVRGTGESLALTDKIHTLADKEDFEDALDELENPDPKSKDSLAVFASAEEAANDDLGLPTLEESEA